MACLTLINGVVQSNFNTAQNQAGYTASGNATQAGPDVTGLFSAVQGALNEAASQLKTIYTNLSTITSASASSTSTSISAAYANFVSISSAYATLTA